MQSISIRWSLPPLTCALRLFVLYLTMALGAILLSRQPGSIASLWFANAVGLACLAARPRREWLALLVVLALANLGANAMAGDELGRSLAFLPGNALEMLLGGLLLGRFARPAEALDDPAELARLLALAALPVVVGAVVGVAVLAVPLSNWPDAGLRWALGSWVGVLAVLPLGLVLALRGTAPIARVLRSSSQLTVLLLAVAVALWVPGQLPYPFIYVLVPLVLLASLGGLPAAALGGLPVAALLGAAAADGTFVRGHPELSEVWVLLPLLCTLLPPLLVGAAHGRVQAVLAQLRDGEASHRALYQHSPVMMHSINADGLLVAVNDAWLATMGYRREQVLGRPSTDFMTFDSREYARKEVLPRFFREGSVDNVAYQMVTAGGVVIDIRLSAVWEPSHAGRPPRTLAVLQDVTEEKRLAAAFASEHELLRVTLRSIGEGVICTDERGRITFLNPVAEQLLDWRSTDACGRPFVSVVCLQQSNGTPLPDPVSRCLQEGRVQGLPESAVLTSRGGRKISVQDSVAPIRDAGGRLRGTVMVFHDVTEARGLAQRMTYLAHHDALTDLPNRVLLQDRIHQACQFAQRHGLRFAVVFMDLDHFKQVNDTQGHAAGDELLRVIALRLRGTLRASDTVSRLGGDEFVMLLSDIASPEAAAAVARKLSDEVGRPVQLAGREVKVGVSMGLALYPDDGKDPETLMKQADAAMYRCKRDGRGGYQFYSPAYGAAVDERLRLESELRRALQRGEFTLHYQPQVDARSLCPVGVEALLRWERPGAEPVSPAVFIPVAEECGLIATLGLRVLRSACAQARAWQGTSLGELRVAVNVAPAQLATPGFVEQVASILEEHELPARLLELEITESALMQSPAQALEVLHGLKALGLHIAIDDFGTGHSSLSHLKHFPVDVVKIDRAFIRDMETDADGLALVQAIVAMAKSLRLKLVAEGVEADGQATLLRDLDCEMLQGFAFSRALPAADCERWLQAQLLAGSAALHA